MKLLIEPKASLVLTAVGNFLAEQGVKSYLVGGFVRDVLLGRDTADIDIAVVADALEIAPKIAATVGGRYVLLDEVNRVGRVVLTDGSRWEIDFSTIKDNIEQDMERRDFTVDAMAVDFGELEESGADVQLIDPFGGWNDLRYGMLRVVAETAFESDAIRLLRAVRLAAELGFGIDKETEKLIRHNSHLITGVAGERVREELLRLLAISQVGRTVAYLDKLGLLMAVIPELAHTKGETQPKEHFWDVFHHSVETTAVIDFLLRQGTWEYAGGDVLSVVPWSPVLAQHFDLGISHGSNRRLLLKLTALLHDIAKPQTKAIDADGRIRFLGHDKEGAAAVVDILQRLRFSAKEIRLVEIMVRHHLRPGQMGQSAFPSRRAIYRYFRDTGDAGIDVLFFNLADHLATRGPCLDRARWREHAQMVNYVLTQHFQEESLVIPPKLVNGHDLIDVFGISPGPKIGELLEAVHEAQAAREVTNKEDALAYVEHLVAHSHKTSSNKIL